MRVLYSILFTLCFSAIAIAQKQSLLFEKTWSNYYLNELTYADELPNGDFLLTGTYRFDYFGTAPGEPQFYACRMDKTGNILWQKDWGTIGEWDRVTKTIKCRDNSYLVIGYGLSGMGGGVDDFEASRIDADGNVIFHRYYDFNYTDLTNDVIETSDSCFIICGLTAFTPSDTGEPAFIKIDQLGNEIWRKTQSNYAGYNPTHICSTIDGGFMILGMHPSLGEFYAKYNSTGSMQWVKYPLTPNSQPVDYPGLIFSNSDGTCSAFYSTTYMDGSDTIQGLLQRYDLSGNVLGYTEFKTRILPVYFDPLDNVLSGIGSDYSFYRMDADSVFRRKVELPSDHPTTIWMKGFISTRDGGCLGFGQFTPDPTTTWPTFYIAKFATNGDDKADDFSSSVNVYPNPSIDGNITLSFDMTSDEIVNVSILSADGKLIYSNSIFCPANSYTELPVRLEEASTDAGLYVLEAKTSTATYRKKLVVMHR